MPLLKVQNLTYGDGDGDVGSVNKNDLTAFSLHISALFE